MPLYYPLIVNHKEYEYIYSTKVDTWATDYPKLYYSFNLDANDSTLGTEIGLYSWTQGYHKIFNSLQFVIKASATINSLAAGETHKIEIWLGSTESLCPVGYIWHNLPKKSDQASIVKSFSNGKLTINNLELVTNTDYTIS